MYQMYCKSTALKVVNNIWCSAFKEHFDVCNTKVSTSNKMNEGQCSRQERVSQKNGSIITNIFRYTNMQAGNQTKIVG